MPPESGAGGPRGSRRDDGGARREIIIEYTPIGGSVKVTAVDVETGTEVSVVGPATAAEVELERVAVRKLRYVMEKNGHIKKEGGTERSEPPAGGGIIV
ncbi:hypothetical protein Plav_2906 [Parvibaculum lavamentivorans DS-1]|uniref:DUF6898 domain-containing protein n=1 Tax=Parvibaculum lavamentivorans (strain DS-1 / DSM 13023 / NCIMB 13966) TaxID=402881 RepID=A7HX80_PARL1|nr:hypothetical protein [Parvibaculum lavamentivorans]ABS64513.1 hypothetical protein Plav_2906 [Parvibaculum lavamentivorans DS-1]